MVQPITAKQKEQISRFLEDASRVAARSSLAQVPLDKNGAQQVIARHDELKVAIERATANALRQLSLRDPVLDETMLLKPVTTAIVPSRTKPFNAAAFYQTGTRLYVYDTFADRLDLGARQTVDWAPERPYVASLLKVRAYDKAIRKDLPETHLSTLEDIAVFIAAQPGGKSGFLRNNGYANIFYTLGKNGEVFAVVVYWRSANRKWLVFDWELDEVGRWNAGHQVLCPGTAVL